MTIHNAPPVAYPLGRSNFLNRVLLGLWAGGLTLSIVWLWMAQRADWRVGLAFFAVGSAGLAMRSGLKGLPTGQLVWDGNAWRWESAGYQTGIAEYDVSVVADLQSRLLLRLQNPASASLWLWLERSALPERWLDLRRAIYATRRVAPGNFPHDLHLAAVLAPAAQADIPLTRP